MIADLGTKALTVSRFEELRSMMGMTLGVEKAGACEKGENEKSSNDPKQGCLESMSQVAAGSRLQVAILMALISRVKGDDDENQRDDRWDMYGFMLFYTLLVVGMTLLVQHVGMWSCRRCVQKRRAMSSEAGREVEVKSKHETLPWPRSREMEIQMEVDFCCGRGTSPRRSLEPGLGMEMSRGVKQLGACRASRSGSLRPGSDTMSTGIAMACLELLCVRVSGVQFAWEVNETGIHGECFFLGMVLDRLCILVGILSAC